MSKFKKLVKLWRYLLLLFIIAIFLNSCTADSLPLQTQKLQGNILILLPLNDDSNAMITTALQEFKRLNPDVNIIIEYNQKEHLLQRFIQESKKGLGATAIIDFSRQIPELAKSGNIRPIPESSIDISRYFASMLTQVRYQGKIYGVPLASHTRILCYNQAKLQISQDPILSQPPTKLDGLIERARQGYSVGMVSSFEDTLWGMGTFGSSFIDDKGYIDPQLEGWSKWLEWLKNAAIQPNFVLVREKRDILHQAFAEGRLTYYVCNSNEIPNLRKTLHDNLKVALLPGDSFPASPLLYTRVMMFNQSASPNEMNIGLALAKFLTNAEQQIYGMVVTQSYIPSNRHISLDMGLLPIQLVLLQQAKTVVAIPLDDLGILTPVLKQAELLYQQAIAGEISTTEAAQKLTVFIRSQISQPSEEYR